MRTHRGLLALPWRLVRPNVRLCVPRVEWGDSVVLPRGARLVWCEISISGMTDMCVR